MRQIPASLRTCGTKQPRCSEEFQYPCDVDNQHWPGKVHRNHSGEVSLSIHKLISQWVSSALMRHNRLYFIMRFASG
jgi:hypothetical protein